MWKCCCNLKIPWRLNVVLDCLVTSIDEAPRVKDSNRTSGLHSGDENALLRAVKSGQTSAFNELWQSHSSRLFQTTFRITGNREDAEDALQGALLNAFVHLKTFDGRSSFLTWLTRIAVNSARMIVRKNRSTLQVSLDDTGDGGGQTEAGTLRAPSPDPEAHFVLRERHPPAAAELSSGAHFAKAGRTPGKGSSEDHGDFRICGKDSAISHQKHTPKIIERK